MYGIEPTHMEELRRKQAVRIFFEERLVELQDIFLRTLSGIVSLLEVTEVVFQKTKIAVKKNKQFVIGCIAVLIVMAIICL